MNSLDLPPVSFGTALTPRRVIGVDRHIFNELEKMETQLEDRNWYDSEETEVYILFILVYFL
jgi:hypothetical protein